MGFKRVTKRIENNSKRFKEIREELEKNSKAFRKDSGRIGREFEKIWKRIQKGFENN